MKVEDCCGAEAHSSDDEELGYPGSMKAARGPLAKAGCEASAERVTVSRSFFEKRMRNVAFSSWEDLLVVLVEEEEAASELGNSGTFVFRHGMGETSLRLDPLQVFGALAAVLIQTCMWGIVGFCGKINPWLALVVSVAYGAVLWVVVHSVMKQLAGMIWPNLPCAVAITGYIVAMIIHDQVWGKDDPENGSHGSHWTSMLILVLVLSIVPHILSAAWWMRSLSRDPDRAVLAVNVYLGLFAASTIIYTVIEVPNIWDMTQGTLLLMGGAGVGVARWLTKATVDWASVELISWTVNLAALSFFFGAGNLLHIPYAADDFQWALYALLPFVLAGLGWAFERSIPIALSAISCLTIAVRISIRVAGFFGGSSLVGFLVFGMLGVAILYVAQVVWRRSAVSESR